MKRLSDQELEVLLLDEESDRVERKQSWAGDAPTKSREAICAFANKMKAPWRLLVSCKLTRRWKTSSIRA